MIDTVQYREMKAAVSKISNEGAYVEQPVPLVTLAEVTKNSGVNEIEDIMSKCKNFQNTIYMY